jgi:hypothetical protein
MRLDAVGCGAEEALKPIAAQDRVRAILPQPDSVPHVAAFANEALTGSTRNFI